MGTLVRRRTDVRGAGDLVVAIFVPKALGLAHPSRAVATGIAGETVDTPLTHASDATEQLLILLLVALAVVEITLGATVRFFLTGHTSFHAVRALGLVLKTGTLLADARRTRITVVAGDLVRHLDMHALAEFAGVESADVAVIALDLTLALGERLDLARHRVLLGQVAAVGAVTGVDGRRTRKGDVVRGAGGAEKGENQEPVDRLHRKLLKSGRRSVSGWELHTENRCNNER